MHSPQLDFTPHLDPEEIEYTSISLGFIKQEIMSTLDIVDVTKRLGITLRKLPENSDEREREGYASPDVYVGNCPHCNKGEGNLRIFSRQTYGCLNCDWDGEFSDSHDIFQFLEHCRVVDDCHNYDFSLDDGDKEKIKKLFELFPEEFAYLAGKDLYQYNYRWDYFSEAAKYNLDVDREYKDLCEKIRRNQGSGYNTLEPLRRRVSELECIIESHAIVSKIYARQECVHGLLRGKSLSEVLGYDIEDEFAKGNMELQKLSEYIQSERYGLLAEELETIQQRELAEEQRIADEKRACLEEQRIAEESISRGIALQKITNATSLYAELSDFEGERDKFFDSAQYGVVLEGGTPLGVGDFGKLVLIYDAGKQAFSVVIGKHKAESPPPQSIMEAMKKTFTEYMPSSVGAHKDISIPEGARTFGGAQYIMLPNSTILIGGESGSYGSVSREIVEKCFRSLGYSVFFLDNAQYGSIDNVYRSVRNK